MDLDRLRARAEEATAEFERIRAGLGRLQHTLAAITGAATSPDGTVTATVGPRGQLLKLELDPKLYRRPDSRALATTITETVHRAAEQAMAKVEAACRPFIPDDQVRAHLDMDFDGVFRRLDTEFETLREGERR